MGSRYSFELITPELRMPYDIQSHQLDICRIRSVLAYHRLPVNCMSRETLHLSDKTLSSSYNSIVVNKDYTGVSISLSMD